MNRRQYQGFREHNYLYDTSPDGPSIVVKVVWTTRGYKIRKAWAVPAGTASFEDWPFQRNRRDWNLIEELLLEE